MVNEAEDRGETGVSKSGHGFRQKILAQLGDTQLEDSRGNSEYEERRMGGFGGVQSNQEEPHLIQNDKDEGDEMAA